MIQRIKDKRGVVARFGSGTVKVKPYTLKTRFGGQIELTQCAPAPVGSVPPEGTTAEGTAKIVLDFATVASLDVLIAKLQALREDMVNEFSG